MEKTLHSWLLDSRQQVNPSGAASSECAVRLVLGAKNIPKALKARAEYFCEGETSYQDPAGKREIWLLKNQMQHHKANYKRDFGLEKIA